MYSEDDYNVDDLIPGKSKSKHKDLLSQIKDMEDDSYTTPKGFNTSSFLPSSMLKESKKEKKEKHHDNTDYDADAWFNEMMSFRTTKMDKSSKYKYDLFESAGIIGKKKKKKKKKKDGEDLIDYRREFEPEMALYKNLLVEQNRFTETLQKEFDSLKSTKSSSRGVTKQMTDLIENITDARTLAMQLVEKNVNAKKLIAELSLKQKKELGGANGDGENMADFASTYLKQMLNDRQALFNGGSGDNTVSEYTEDELFEELSLSLQNDSEMGRPDEVDRYLKYENRNVTIYVTVASDEQDIESNYEFIAKDENGEIIDDYPMPNHTKISVNRSTNIATDTYGKKYNILWY